MIKNLSHVSLPYIKLEKLIHFYVKILGLKIVHKFKNKNKKIYGIILKCGNKTFLEFFKKNKKNINKNYHFCFNVKNIYLIEKKLKKYNRNIIIKRGKTDKVLQFMSNDFEGNIIEFHQLDKKAKKFYKV